MSGTSEERLARLEVLVGEQRDDIKELRVQVAELVRVAHMGRGVLWLLLPTGTLIGWLLGHLLDWLPHK
jgi:uncharacterized coiled-coil protein SlyX